MATYNGAEFLTEQIESIINQTHQNWTLFIHDDGSTDDTVAISKAYASRYAQKIVFIDDGVKCGGAKENFTHLLNSIDDRYDYVMFSDQDDVWLEHKIEKTLALMLETECGEMKKPMLVHTDLIVVDSELNTISPSMRASQKLDVSKQNNIQKMCADSIVSGCTMMINAALVELGRSIPDEAIMHDTWIPLVALKNGGTIAYLAEGTLLYRQHGGNTEGAKEVNIGFYVRRLLALANTLRDYKKMFIQCRRAGIKMGLFTFLRLRLYTVGYKIFGDIK